jgi:hypothetical protein
VLGGYHNFMIFVESSLYKEIYKKVRFSPKKKSKFFMLGKGINIVFKN